MSENLFEVNILFRNKKVAGYKASSLVCPCIDGKIGIMANHAPLICPIKSGELKISGPDGVITVELPDGILFVRDNEVYILCE